MEQSMKPTPYVMLLLAISGLLSGCMNTGAGTSLAGPGDGVAVGEASDIRRLVPAARLERSAAEQFEALKKKALEKQALLADSDPIVVRLRSIAERLKPYASQWNPDAQRWKWEVAVFKSDQINAFCMPGGKIGFYTGILTKLKLTDDEAAMIMGHEMAHALREHSRDRLAKAQLTDIGASVLSAVLGFGEVGRQAMGFGTQIIGMKFSRDDESDADLVGLDIAARAGFDPRAAISLWRKMQAANKGAPPEWFSTHPASSTRIEDISRNLPRVLPLYAKVIGRTLDTLPPDPSLR
jgi:Zn-dependent protease with chaperone function